MSHICNLYIYIRPARHNRQPNRPCEKVPRQTCKRSVHEIQCTTQKNISIRVCATYILIGYTFST
jgi:hypothetical protein